jgi:hypothetical protein
MAIVIGLALGLIVVGLVMAFLGPKSIPGVLGRVVFWVGVALVVIGLILLLTPVLVWVNVQLRSMLGNP